MKEKRTTPSQMWSQWVSSARFALLPMAMIGGLALGTIAACGPPDAGSVEEKTCIADDDCELGTVCILTSKTCQAVECMYCITGQICYANPDGTESCSKPECTSNAQCGGMESCVQGSCVESTCSDRSDCPEGQICNQLAGVCQNPPEVCGSNFDCPQGSVCKEDGSCAPGCTTDLDCEDVMSFCNTDTALCEPGCRTDASCADDQVCNAERQCECDPSKCPANFECDDVANACLEKQVESCDDVTCGEGFVCNAVSFQCEPAPEQCSTLPGDPNACPPGERCNQATGNCEVAVCTNGKSQADCDGTPNPVFSDAFCECVQCLDDMQCPVGSSCNTNGQCIEGCEACDASAVPTGCGMEAPNCISGCCIECMATSDCTNPGDVCLNSGRCGPPPSCAVDPSVCPTGTTCMAGTCQPNTNPGTCTPGDPTACPSGQTCMLDPLTGMNRCQGGGNNMCTMACPVGCMAFPGLGEVCTCSTAADCPGGGGILGCLEGICSPF